jgi:membrane protein CcdC involved in cytochrome C biogenesis
MATMSASENSRSSPRSTHLVRRLILLALLVSTYALGFAILVFTGRTAPTQFLAIAADLTLGLVAGLGARLLLRKRNVFVRCVVALSVLVIGLNILGYFSNWNLGIALVFGRATPDWFGLAHLALGMLFAFSALLGWRRSDAGTGQPEVANPAHLWPNGRVPRNSGRQGSQPSRVRRANSRTLIGTQARPARSHVVVNPPLAPRPRVKRRLGRKVHVQLATVEEHRCPYCLELVNPKDPRGVVECKVCHTLHHADCWGITGSCQVPHYNS